MTFTHNNHYHPCFWTAHWNQEYFDSNDKHSMQAREQKVYSLNILADKILNLKVEKIFYEKNSFNAKLTPSEMKNSCRKFFPEDKSCEDLDEFREGDYLIADFENLLTKLESGEPYKSLLKIINRGKGSIYNLQEKVFLALFLLIQGQRSFAIWNSLLEMEKNIGFSKFEALLFFKWKLSNFDFLFPLIHDIILAGKWIFHQATHHIFPLNDSPILASSHNVMIALSPRLLLEIDKTQKADPYICEYRNRISNAKMEEFRIKTIGNTHREIIFNDKNTLEDWQKSKEYQERRSLIKNKKSYNIIENMGDGREVFKINAYSNSINDLQKIPNYYKRSVPHMIKWKTPQIIQVESERFIQRIT